MATLHIVGNSFDLAHGIESKYSDFKTDAWRCASYNGYYLGVLENCYPQKNIKIGELMLWSDLERALGNLDFQQAFSLDTEDIEPEEDHEFRYLAQMEDASEYMLQNMFAVFHKLFEDWVNHINISFEKFECIPYFDSKGLFLSFNYTETLETLCNIPMTNIRYIHGRRGTTDKLIVDHCNNIDRNDYLPENPKIYECQAYQSIADIVNKERKNVSDIIFEGHDFWQQLSNIDKVVVYGHSLSDVDQPYFKQIINSIYSSSEWYFSIYYHDLQERTEATNKVLNMINYMGVSLHKCRTFWINTVLNKNSSSKCRPANMFRR
ncbi:bacteriophage abortive infection AbiH family protein [Bacteroides sp. 224]|uniref:bacteriophage abortive infection AbiH family protein n=1 Tax=Bacteroides sp. 224 TaxID=2302936 RepID=UPI0013D45205|nr:bacteriophage abortive infection AbiH family protein [Bacteroides sp. 224]NDV63807.1 hypothetical protein [Bacteroides sp. 224]